MNLTVYIVEAFGFPFLWSVYTSVWLFESPLIFHTVLITIQDKVNNPSPDDPFEPEIGAVLKNDKSKFLTTAKEWTKKCVCVRSACVAELKIYADMLLDIMSKLTNVNHVSLYCVLSKTLKSSTLQQQ